MRGDCLTRARLAEAVGYCLNSGLQRYPGGGTVPSGTPPRAARAAAQTLIPHPGRGRPKALSQAFPCADPAAPLAFVAATMPPWPGEGEAFAVEGRWPATVP